MIKLTREELFSAVRKLHDVLPDREQLLYIKDLAKTFTKYAGGRVGHIGLNCVEIWETGKKITWDKIFTTKG